MIAEMHLHFKTKQVESLDMNFGQTEVQLSDFKDFKTCFNSSSSALLSD